MKIGQFMWYYKRKLFIKKLYKKCDLKTSFQRIFCKNEREEVCMLFGQIVIVLLLHIQYKGLASKVSFSNKVVINSLQTQ